MSVKSNKLDRNSPKRRKLGHDGGEDSANPSTKSANTGEDSSDVFDKREDPDTRSSSHKPRSNSASSNRPTLLPPGGINKSSALALQLEDLNNEISPNYEKLRTRWIPVVQKLEAIIKQLPQKSPVTAVDALKSFRKQGISIPFPEPRPDNNTNYKFEYQPPARILVGGLLPKSLGIKGDNSIDLKVIMPKSMLQEKDYLNHRAFHKAAFYLAAIALGVKEGTSSDFDLAFSREDGIELLPVLCLTPKDAKLAKFRFEISVGFPHDAISMEKTLPTKSCLRHPSSHAESDGQEPTPFYNSCLRSAATSVQYEELLKTVRSQQFDEACRIGQCWLQQRGFSGSISGGGFGYMEWALMCTLLLRGGGHRGHALFSKQYSSLQFFKAVLQVLAGRDLRDALVVGGAVPEIPRSEVPIIFDGTTGVNILYKMSPWSYQSLRQHAQISLAAVNARNQENFDSVFVLRVAEPLLQFDQIFTVNLPVEASRTTVEQRRYLHKLHAVLVRGFGDRVSLVDFRLPEQHTRPLNQDVASTGAFVLEVCLATNPENVGRMVDRGPSAEEEDEAADFQKFWGEKAERRRFKDGSITESLVWVAGTAVTLQIIRHLVMHHFKLLPSSVALKSPDLMTDLLRHHAPLEVKDAYRVINNTYQGLSSTLHNLAGLPLPIRSIAPADAALRSSTPSHPLLPSSTKPINIIIQFDSSTRWPDSLPAIQHTKIAFLLKVAELLPASKDDITTRVGLENTDAAGSGYLNTSFLDIIYPSPAPGLSPVCFRARIYHDREEHLLQTTLADKTLHGSVRDSLTMALASFKRHFIAAPIHTTTIRTLCTRFPALSDTIRLLKKWVSSHLLLQMVPEEILEICAAHVFLHPAPWSSPGSPTTAFLRCLHLLARWDFAFAPLIVDTSLSQDMTAAQIEEARTRFQAWRKLDPGLNNVVWFVSTSSDATGTVWTQNARPERVIAGRLRALANAAVEVAKTNVANLEHDDWSGLFHSPLEDFDFRIHIRPSVLKGYAGGRSRRESDTQEFKNLQLNQSLDIESIGYDTVALFLDDLKAAFGATALFFHDSHGGDVIAGLWKPVVSGTKEWRVRLGWSSVPITAEQSEDKEMCVFNKQGVLAEIAALGDGIVKVIKTREQE